MFQTHVLSVSGVSRTLQVFYLDVAKLDLDVAYVAMAIHVCFKRMFQVFRLFSVACYECFNWMF
jgi:hypothetical protein